MKLKITLLGVALIAGGVAYSKLQSQTQMNTSEPDAGGRAMVAVTVPDLEGNALLGETMFNSVCAACHGKNATGQVGVAPPLIHKIYEPSHHSDEAFQMAAANGVRSHHWRFGDMPPVKGLTRGDVTMIVAYIRQLQRANGIN